MNTNTPACLCPIRIAGRPPAIGWLFFAPCLAFAPTVSPPADASAAKAEEKTV